MAELTKREQQVLEYIQKAVAEKGYPPSVREIGEAVGLTSTSTVHSYLIRLEKKGCLRRGGSIPRAITINKRPDILTISILGQIVAGEPALASENQEDVIALPADLTGYGELFALRVRGNSMVDAGIFDGDIVVVRKQPTAENGDIVVALIEDEATVKRFFKEDGHIRLQPENRAMQPIITDEAVILGRVVSLVRKY
ncbi:MAG: transcriptional repressor LexA [Armatimonadetes bacterium]|nr:transcriptional repressor LexA [Armatimonadota bacterium]